MGVQINGDTGNISATKADYSGNVTIGGTLTYEDVTNIDSVGLVTARTGIEIGARPGVAASISVDGNAIFSGITTVGGDVKVGSGVTLSPDGNIFATGISTFGGDIKTSGSNIVLGDSGGSNDDRIQFGASQDLEIYHDGSNSKIRNNTGRLDIETDNFRLYNYASSENMIDGTADGSVNLYYNNSKKFETTNTGVTVTGEVSATSFSGIGAITMVDSWGLSSSANYSNGNNITNNWTRRTGTHGGNIGNAMTESSGVFTFPQTGLYYISMQFGGYAYDGTQAYYGVRLMLSTNGGSSFSNVSNYYTSSQNSQYSRVVGQELLDVTSTSDFKIKFQIEVAANISIQGGQGRTSVFFVRYGDT